MSETAVPDFFLRTKLHRPSLPDDHIIRPRLLSALESVVHHSLTLLVAPAGYGKTTLLNGWIEQTAYPVVWLSLDEGDNQFAVFLDYFVAGIHTIFPDSGEQLRILREGAALPPMPVVNALLVNALDALPQDFVLVLDDYHLITTPEIHTLLDNLLHHAPRPLHLILLSRQEPPLAIAQLRARHQVTEIRMKELRFSLDEVARFTERNLPTAPDAETVAILTEKTEGWAVGLRLATIAIRQWGIADEQPTVLQVENQYVMEYLVNEVLAKQPTAVREFLLITSLLERFCPPLCAALMDSQPAANPAILPQLARDGLFVEALDSQGQWFRYHQLFRQALHQRLVENYSAEEIAVLHLRASAWLAANGFVEEAIDYALRGGDEATAVNILAKQSNVLINEERWLLTDKFLHKFPPKLLHQDPQLLVLAGWRHLVQMRLDQVERIQRSLAADLEKSEFPPDVTLFLRSSSQIFRAVENNWDGNFEDARVDTQAALAAAPYEWGLMRSYAWSYLATAIYFLQGEQAAVKVLQVAEADDWEDSVLVRIRRKISFSVVYLQSANLTMLMQEGEQGIKLIQNYAENAYTSASFLHFYIGSAYYLQNKLALAAEHFTAVMEKRYVSQSYMVVLSAIGLALVHQAQNQGEAARQVMDTIVAYCLELEHPQMVLVARAFQAELAWRQGQMAQASHWASQAISMPAPKVMPFTFHPFLTLPKILLAEDTPVSRQQAETVLTQLSELAFSTHTIRLQIEALTMQAILYQAQGKTAAAHKAVKEAIRLTEPAEIIRPFVDLGPKMASLLKQAYGAGERPSFVQRVLAAFPAHRPLVSAASSILVESLTEREMEVLGLLAQRMSNKEIAALMFISPATAKRHTSNIYQKLGVKNRREAVTRAAALDLIQA